MIELTVTLTGRGGVLAEAISDLKGKLEQALPVTENAVDLSGSLVVAYIGSEQVVGTLDRGVFTPVTENEP